LASGGHLQFPLSMLFYCGQLKSSTPLLLGRLSVSPHSPTPSFDLRFTFFVSSDVKLEKHSSSADLRQAYFKVIQNPGFLPDHPQNWITCSFYHSRHSL